MDARTPRGRAPIETLTAIPVLEVPAADEPAVASALAQPERLALLLAQARRRYTALGLHFADDRSRHWSARLESPYARLVGSVERAIGRPGAFLLGTDRPCNGAPRSSVTGRRRGRIASAPATIAFPIAPHRSPRYPIA